MHEWWAHHEAAFCLHSTPRYQASTALSAMPRPANNEGKNASATAKSTTLNKISRRKVVSLRLAQDAKACAPLWCRRAARTQITMWMHHEHRYQRGMLTLLVNVVVVVVEDKKEKKTRKLNLKGWAKQGQIVSIGDSALDRLEFAG